MSRSARLVNGLSRPYRHSRALASVRLLAALTLTRDAVGVCAKRLSGLAEIPSAYSIVNDLVTRHRSGEPASLPSPVPHVSRINEVMHAWSIRNGAKGKRRRKIDRDHSALGARMVGR